MYSIISGALIISLLHAVIPNHWLPIIAIARKEQWTTAEVTKVTFACAMAHGISTILIGVVLGFLGAKLDTNVTNFTNVIAPIVVSGGSCGSFSFLHFELSKSEDKNRRRIRCFVFIQLFAMVN